MNFQRSCSDVRNIITLSGFDLEIPRLTHETHGTIFISVKQMKMGCSPLCESKLGNQSLNDQEKYYGIDIHDLQEALKSL